MDIMKSGKYVTGAKLTVAESKALTIEAKRLAARQVSKIEVEVIGTILWRLKKSTNLSVGDLKKLYFMFKRDFNGVIDRYDKGLLGDHLDFGALQADGIDIFAWENETAMRGEK